MKGLLFQNYKETEPDFLAPFLYNFETINGSYRCTSL